MKKISFILYDKKKKKVATVLDGYNGIDFLNVSYLDPKLPILAMGMYRHHINDIPDPINCYVADSLDDLAFSYTKASYELLSVSKLYESDLLTGVGIYGDESISATILHCNHHNIYITASKKFLEKDSESVYTYYAPVISSSLEEALSILHKIHQY